MTFETPIQPVPVGRGRIATSLVAIVGVAALLAWSAWRTPSGASPTSPPDLVAVTTASPAPAPPATAAAPTPYVPPVGPPTRSYLPFVDSPTLDLFRPRWSIVGVRNEPYSQLQVSQVPITTSSGFIEGTSAEAICQVGVFGSSLVAALPAHTFRLIGIVAPAGDITSPVELTRVDGTVVSDYDLLVPPPPDGSAPRASARLFAQFDLQRWPAGTYRFHLEAADGTPRFAYACLVPPSLLDGTDFAASGP